MDEKLQSSEILPLIRSKVKERLTNSPAFRALSPDQRAAIAHDTVKALHYIVGGEDGESRPTSMTLAGQTGGFAPAGARSGAAAPVPAANAKKTVSPGSGIGAAARAGGEAFTDMINDVDFPSFVGGLIDGVFNSIVTTSIKQMEAYAELVKNVSKSVDQYMKDNVSEDSARDYLLEKYPDHLEVDVQGETPGLKPKQGAEDAGLPDFFADLGLQAPITSLDTDNVEQQLVPAARRRIAMDRQQLLATMVMMGVNRLVVTNGTIEASCLFELDTTDSRKRHDKFTSTDSKSHTDSSSRGSDGSRTGSHKGDEFHFGKGGFSAGKYDNSSKSSWFDKSSTKDTAKFKMTTAKSQDSEETIKMHAQLTGKVKVNFKSDYFPMEKMIDALQVNQIQEKSAAGMLASSQPAQAQPALPAPPLPPMPTLPMPTPGLPKP
ncbi:MAG: hypothetical protein ABUT39_28320 [Acidobacteriota bacterium]